MYIKKLDFELSSLIFYVFMYVVSCRDAEFTFPGLIGERVDKLTLDACCKFGGSSSNIEPVRQFSAPLDILQRNPRYFTLILFFYRAAEFHRMNFHQNF